MATKKSTKIIVLIIWLAVFVPIITLAIIFTGISRGKIGYIPDFKELENPQSNLATEIYSSDNVILGKYYEENRTVVQFEDLSPNLVNALIATEDIRFYEHSGIDFRALFRVAVKSVILQQGAGGGSTISQQLAKNLYKMREVDIVHGDSKIARTWGKVLMKFQEWVTASKLEKNYTKEEILVMYLNTVTFGHNSFGIKSASYIFFGTTPDSLTIEQSAILVGVLRAPTAYSPLLNPENSFIRRNTVLSQIEKYQDKLKKTTNWKPLPASTFDSLRAMPLTYSYHKETHNEGLATYYREYLRGYITATKPAWSNYPEWNKTQFYEDSLLWEEDELYGWCSKNQKPNGENYNIYTDGLRIYSTINSRMQNYAEIAVAKHLGKGDEPLQEIFYKDLKNRTKRPFDWRVSDKEIEQIMLSTMKRSERWNTMKRNGKSDEQIIDAFHQPLKMSVFSWYGDVDTTMTPYDSVLYYKEFLRAGFVSIEPETGYVRAYVGGIDYNHFKYDHVMVSRRQVGSTFKPFVYALAMMPGGYSPCYKVLNIPYTIDVWHNNKKEAWTPKYSPSKYDDQMISLQLGLALSLNQISAWVIKQYGPESVINLVRGMGIKSPLEPVYSLCVGAGEVKLMEMVSAYCTFANKGVHVSPVLVTRIEDRYGNVLASFTPEKNQAMDENTAYRVIELMRGVIQFGTSTRMRVKYNITSDIAGKTGTTNDNSDGWFMGCTPHLVSGAWVGGEERSIRFSSGLYGQGASMALPIWAFYMQQIYNDPNLPYKKTDYFQKPAIDDGVETDCNDYYDPSDGG
ncbi:MAG: transglycosylase domain-containing protein, partial [Bacteroidales bacterium]|nr:transglycosylase domain-containing protein [Bacteroidales bacterium]